MCAEIIPNWRIIWLDQSVDLQQATMLAAKIPAAGLVSQQNRLALRVPKGAFGNAWKTLFLAAVHNLRTLTPWGSTKWNACHTVWPVRCCQHARPIIHGKPTTTACHGPWCLVAWHQSTAIRCDDAFQRKSSPDPCAQGQNAESKQSDHCRTKADNAAHQHCGQHWPFAHRSMGQQWGRFPAAVASIPNMCLVSPTCLYSLLKLQIFIWLVVSNMFYFP